MEYGSYFAFGLLTSGLVFYLAKNLSKRPRKRSQILPATPTLSDSSDSATCLMFSDGSTLFTDGEIIIKASRRSVKASSL
jgi:hypothetical protein